MSLDSLRDTQAWIEPNPADAGRKNPFGKVGRKMPVYYRREVVDGESSWAPLAIVLTVLVVALLLGYFFWYAPAGPVAAGTTHDLTVTTPAPPSGPHTMVLPGSRGHAGT